MTFWVEKKESLFVCISHSGCVWNEVTEACRVMEIKEEPARCPFVFAREGRRTIICDLKLVVLKPILFFKKEKKS